MELNYLYIIQFRFLNARDTSCCLLVSSADRRRSSSTFASISATLLRCSSNAAACTQVESANIYNQVQQQKTISYQNINGGLLLNCFPSDFYTVFQSAVKRYQRRNFLTITPYIGTEPEMSLLLLLES